VFLNQINSLGKVNNQQDKKGEMHVAWLLEFF
jgi:hypothetical protein